MWTFIKAIPGIVALLTYLKDTYEKYKQEKIKREADKRKTEIEKITKELKNAKSDEERKKLLKRLSNIDNT